MYSTTETEIASSLILELALVICVVSFWKISSDIALGTQVVIYSFLGIMNVTSLVRLVTLFKHLMNEREEGDVRT